MNTGCTDHFVGQSLIRPGLTGLLFTESEKYWYMIDEEKYVEFNFCPQCGKNLKLNSYENLEWISADVKPEFPQDVLLLCTDIYDKNPLVIEGSYYPRPGSEWAIKLFGFHNCYVLLNDVKGNYEIVNPLRKDEFYIGKVAYWMPMPEFPIVIKSEKDNVRT